jgi:WD40 repeat protein
MREKLKRYQLLVIPMLILSLLACNLVPGRAALPATITPVLRSADPDATPEAPLPAGICRLAYVSQQANIWDILLTHPAGGGDVQLTTHDPGRWQGASAGDGSLVGISLSPAGLIAFNSDEGGWHAIYRMNLDGSGLQRLTHNDGWHDYWPAWSPDGTSIAFSSNRDGSFEIYLMDADGSNPRRLTESESDASFPAWSPDGERIAFIDTRAGSIELIEIASGRQTRLTPDDAAYYQPNWSPDGRRLVFAAQIGGGRNIFTLDVEGGQLRQLTEGSDSHSLPVFSPDGSHIAFSSDREGGMRIYIMDADGGNVRRLTDGAGQHLAKDWLPNCTGLPDGLVALELGAARPPAQGPAGPPAPGDEQPPADQVVPPDPADQQDPVDLGVPIRPDDLGFPAEDGQLPEGEPPGESDVQEGDEPDEEAPGNFFEELISTVVNAVRDFIDSILDTLGGGGGTGGGGTPTVTPQVTQTADETPDPDITPTPDDLDPVYFFYKGALPGFVTLYGINCSGFTGTWHLYADDLIFTYDPSTDMFGGTIKDASVTPPIDLQVTLPGRSEPGPCSSATNCDWESEPFDIPEYIVYWENQNGTWNRFTVSTQNARMIIESYEPGVAAGMYLYLPALDGWFESYVPPMDPFPATEISEPLLDDVWSTHEFPISIRAYDVLPPRARQKAFDLIARYCR